MNLAWLLAGAFFVIGFICFEVAFALIGRHPATKMSMLTADQIRVKLETHAEDEDKFVDDMCSLLRLMLTKGNPECRNVRLWSGRAQRFIRRVISDSIPRLPEYRETDDNDQEYLEQVAAWLDRAGNEDELEGFRMRFPHISLPNRVDDYHGVMGW